MVRSAWPLARSRQEAKATAEAPRLASPVSASRRPCDNSSGSSGPRHLTALALTNRPGHRSDLGRGPDPPVVVHSSVPARRRGIERGPDVDDRRPTAPGATSPRSQPTAGIRSTIVAADPCPLVTMYPMAPRSASAGSPSPWRSGHRAAGGGRRSSRRVQRRRAAGRRQTRHQGTSDPAGWEASGSVTQRGCLEQRFSDPIQVTARTPAAAPRSGDRSPPGPHRPGRNSTARAGWPRPPAAAAARRSPRPARW